MSFFCSSMHCSKPLAPWEISWGLAGPALELGFVLAAATL